MKRPPASTVLLCLVVFDALFAPMLRTLISEPSDLALRFFVLLLVGMVLINALFITLAIRQNKRPHE